jgi:hypothetical protein
VEAPIPTVLGASVVLDFTGLDSIDMTEVR